MSGKFKIKFPKIHTHNLDQDEEYFYLIESDDKERKILFHEYAEIYKIAGLYERLFYERLKCKSPSKVAEALRYIVSQAQDNFSELRVLDLGAGNGVMGEELKKYGCARLVGADIIYEAYEACERDRPTIYDAYNVVDFCNLTEEQRNCEHIFEDVTEERRSLLARSVLPDWVKILVEKEDSKWVVENELWKTLNYLKCGRCKLLRVSDEEEM